MNVILYSATGRAGRCILDELISRGHQITAVARNLDKLPEQLPNHGKFILGHKLKKHGVYWQIFSDNHKPCGGRNRAVAFSVLHFVRPCF
ncbi:MAG: hypothetical protein ACK5PS_13305 [Desulfopila sp.]